MIRILRLMEYTYEDNKTAEADMANWSVPPIGTGGFGVRKKIRSTILTDLNFEPEVVNESD